ncbi:hypothetical protein HPULCUR_007731 [Helicostylum pulchrum]|uniref:Chaperone DnaJ C-terminal domain-containing protein n=1 Tax=Helicostylum pulchrum TaxID=562976 RepID=A0ABP9Y6N9_9FUNG
MLKVHTGQNEKKFKEIVHACISLSCAETRRIHDDELLAARNLAESSNNSRISSSSSSSDTPHSTKRQKATADGKYRLTTSPSPSISPSPPLNSFDYNIRTTTCITLNQSYTGLERHFVKYVETIYCNTCEGVGETHRCVQCVGEGLISTQVLCKACDGVGAVTSYLECEDCGGKRHEECGLHVKIDKGITDLYTLQLNDCGNLMPDGVTRGNLIIEVLVDNQSADGLFKRRGDSLRVNLDIDLRDAILGYGDKPAFRHLDGKPVHLLRHPGAVLKPGSKINIPGYGMPRYLDSHGLYGDLHITFNVVFPDYVNTPESLDDRKVIYKFFMTEKERKARENPIVIDDNDDDNNDNDKKDDDDDSS